MRGPRIRQRFDPRIGRGMGQRVGLAARLFVATGLVIAAGAGTLLIVALLFAPPLFQDHLQRAGLPAATPSQATVVRDEIDAAFGQALLVALAVAVAAAVVAASAISWLVSRRLAAPVQDVARAAQRLADGHYDTVVPDPRLGPEFATLAGSVNRLSRRLAETETTRRRLTADLAHQLRTPLASLQATVEALTDGVLDLDSQALATLGEQTARLRRLVADLEKVSRAEERQLLLHPCVQPLSSLLHRCVATIADRYQAAGVDLTLDSDPATTAVRVDPDRIAEAITNLLDNALRHTPTGGRVTLTVTPDVNVTGARLGSGRVRIEVRDTGEGFEPADADRLFERFYRSVRRGGADPGTDGGGVGGSGIGLTIARAIAQAHGGDLRAHSPGPGHGATFTITLPAADGQ